MSSQFRTLKISDPRFEQDGLRHITVKSPALQSRGDMSVYVPENKDKHSDVPLVILLHGVYGSHHSWPMTAGSHITTRNLIDSGKIRPMVVVSPSDGLWGDGSGYLDHPFGNYEKWIVEDVPQSVKECIPFVTEQSPIFLSGLSMGGYGTLRLGAKYSEVFQALSAHSAITNIEELQGFIEEDTSIWNYPRYETEVIALMMANKDILPPFRFDCGSKDPLLPGNRKLHQQLKKADIHHVYEEFPGGHEWPYWEKHLVDTLLFFEKILNSEG